MSDAPTVIVLFKSSWGEVDAIIPVLWEIKERYSARIVVVYNSRRFFDKKGIKSFLSRKMREVASAMIYPRRNTRLIDRLYRLLAPSTSSNENERAKFANTIRQYVVPERVVSVLEPVGPIRGVLSVFREVYERSRVVVFQHSTAVLFKPSPDSHEFGESKNADILLYSSPFGIDNARKNSPFINDVVWVGFPRYDRRWMEILVSDEEFQCSRENRVLQRSGFVVTFFTTHVREDLISEEDFVEVLRDVVRDVFEIENSFLLIKPHPRLKGDLIEKSIDRRYAKRWMISNLQAIQLSALSDAVISMPSSTMVDVALSATPIIEYSRYSNLRYEQLYYTDEGYPCSQYAHLGFVELATSNDDVKRFLARYRDRYMSYETRGSKTVAETLKIDGLASRRAADVIMGGVVS